MKNSLTQYPFNNSGMKPIGTLAQRKLGLALVALGMALASLAAQAAGFREIAAPGVKAGVGYPTDAPLVAQRLGPFDVNMAKDAPVRKGPHEVVLLSHGNSGRYRNHHLTAQALADKGFVVVAPQHDADYLVGGPKTAQALDHRYLELSLALKAVRADAALGPQLAPAPVHGTRLW
jgi:predicted dienelactone hydrolase